MRQPLIALTSGTRLITGGHKLPNGIPDVDLIVQDLEAKVLILCELKWCRKPNGRSEREDRDKEVLKGFSQIKKIREFIEANPKYLLDRGYIAQDISTFSVVRYCVVARDHFVEPPSGSAPLYSYDALAMELENSRDTIESLRSLQSLTWLPIEGVDFGYGSREAGPAMSHLNRKCITRLVVRFPLHSDPPKNVECNSRGRMGGTPNRDVWEE